MTSRSKMRLMEEGGRRKEDGGWRKEDGGRRKEDGVVKIVIFFSGLPLILFF